MARELMRRARLALSGHRRGDLLDYGLLTGERPAQAARDFLTFAWLAERIQPALNDHNSAPLAENKWFFYRWMDSFGVPIPATFGLYDAFGGTTWDGKRPLRTPDQLRAELSTIRPPAVLLKPSGGQQGRGIVLLRELDDAGATGVDPSGSRVSVTDIVAELPPPGGSSPGYIVQEVLEGHPDLRAIAPWSTTPVRVVTIVDRNGEAHVQAAGVSFGRRGSGVSNWHSGGINVAVDVARGVFGDGLLRGSAERIQVHPDSGVRLAGRPVPEWEALRDVCLRAATLMPGLRSVGWDVVPTPTGPRVLEANTGWSLKGVQVHSRGFLGDERIRAQFAAAGAPLPTGPASLVRPQVRRRVRETVKSWRG